MNHPGELGFDYYPSLEVAVGPPFIQVNGYTTVGDPITGPRNTYENAFDYSGSLSWVRGRHEFKFGGGYQHLQVNALQGIATNGFFVFAPPPIVPNAFASFLFGQPVFFLQGLGDFSRGIRGNSANAYVQDTYKATSRLTLNLGLRYELPFPYTEIKNRQTVVDSRPAVDGDTRCSSRIALSRRRWSSGWPDPNVQERVRSAGWRSRGTRPEARSGWSHRHTEFFMSRTTPGRVGHCSRRSARRPICKRRKSAFPILPIPLTASLRQR